MKNKLAIFLAAIFVYADVFAESMVSRYKADFYGYIKTDVIYDTKGNNGLSYGNEAMIYTTTEGSRGRTFRIAAKETRFGFNVTDGGKVSGKIEIDFYGSSAVSSITPQMRHAYIAVNVLEQLEFLAGHTWHLLPMEIPGTINGTIFIFRGSLSDRAPQVRATYKFSDEVSASAAAVRPQKSNVDGSGTASGQPLVQANTVFNVKPVKITLMCAYGEFKDADPTSAAYSQRGSTELIAMGYNIAFGKFILNGQLWTGQNLIDLTGGAFNFNQYGSNAITAKGGFVSLKYSPTKKLFFNIAGGIDDPDDDKLMPTSTSPAKKKNQAYIANINYLLFEKTLLSFEIAQNDTFYKYPSYDDVKGNLRYHMAAKWSF